jgi:DUF1707 SHOCT-like domain
MDEMLRASDRDREKVVGILKEHYAQGRLDQAELDGRMQAALTAKRLGDLHALTRDLPADRPEPPPPPTAQFDPESMLKWLGVTAVVVLMAVLALSVGLFESVSHGVASVVHDVTRILQGVAHLAK